MDVVFLIARILLVRLDVVGCPRTTLEAARRRSSTTTGISRSVRVW
jgi:hypothetical protein